MDGEKVVKLGDIDLGITIGLMVIEDACIDNDVDFMAAIGGDMKQVRKYESVTNLISMAYHGHKLYCKIHGEDMKTSESDLFDKANKDMNFIVELRNFVNETMVKNVPKEEVEESKKKK